jgi:hypothetical protein
MTLRPEHLGDVALAPAAQPPVVHQQSDLPGTIVQQ